MPFHGVKRRFGGRSRRAHGRHMRVGRHIKTAAGYFPRTSLVAITMRSEWNTNSNSAGNSGRIIVPLNGLFQPLLYVDCTAGWGTITDMPPQTYVQIGAGTGLLGSGNSGAAYRQYKVLGCQLEVELMSNTTAPLRFAGFCEYFANIFGSLPNALPSARNMLDNQRFGFDIMIPAAGGQPRPVIWKKYYRVRDVLQLPAGQFASDHGSAEDNDSVCISPIGVGSGAWRPSAANINDAENPPKMVIFNGRVTTALNASLNGTPGAVYYRLKLKYYVQMFGRNDIVVSDAVPEDDLKLPDEDSDTEIVSALRPLDLMRSPVASAAPPPPVPLGQAKLKRPKP